MTSESVLLVADPGSFRDHTNLVYVGTDRVVRALSTKALGNYWALREKQFFRDFIKAGKIVETEEIPPTSLPASNGEWVSCLRHQKIPVISYPYEWCFGMLRDAALLHLELMERSLAEGMILKDATPYNIQWLGPKPIFIDVPSFEPYEGGPWLAYGQFCQMFLFPLMLESYLGVPFQPWLRGALEGITAHQMARLFSYLDVLKPGVFGHVFLQSKLVRSTASNSSTRLKMTEAGFGAELIKVNIHKLRSIISRMKQRDLKTTWSGYEESLPYEHSERSAKESFVSEIIAMKDWGTVWDLGSNTGVFSEIAANKAKYVLGLDFDSAVIERLYQKKAATILPLVYNVLDPSPGLGWCGVERRTLPDRSQPDLVLALALVHHLAITGNVPLEALVKYFASLAANVIVEFVSPEDPMVQTLLANKSERYADYSRQNFETYLLKYFKIQKSSTVVEGKRTLYFLQNLP